MKLFLGQNHQVFYYTTRTHIFTIPLKKLTFSPAIFILSLHNHCEIRTNSDHSNLSRPKTTQHTRIILLPLYILYIYIFILYILHYL